MEDEKKLAQEELSPAEEAVEATDAAAPSEDVAEAPANEEALEVEEAPEASEGVAEVEEAPAPEKKKKKSKKKIIIPVVAIVAVLLISAILVGVVALALAGVLGIAVIAGIAYVVISFSDPVKHLTLTTYNDYSGYVPYYNCYQVPIDEHNRTASYDVVYQVTGRDNKTEALWIPMEYEDGAIVAIGAYAFCDDDYLTTVELPDSVTEIHEYAFACCDNLTDVYFSSNVDFIGSSAFAHCGERITIHYDGPEYDWNKINFGDQWYGDSEIFISCNDGNRFYAH